MHGLNPNEPKSTYASYLQGCEIFSQGLKNGDEENRQLGNL